MKSNGRMIALFYRGWYNENRITGRNGVRKVAYPYEAEEQLLSAASVGNRGRMLAAADAFLAVAEGQCAPEKLRIKLVELIFRAECACWQTVGCMERSMERPGLPYGLMEAGSKQEMRECFLNCIGAIADEAGLPGGGRRSSAMAEQAMAIINRDYAQPLTLESVSDQIHISRFYLSRIFHENCGESFLSYLTRVRMEKAKSLLLTTVQPVREIGAAVGYSDPNYFSRHFRQYTGVSCREFRQNARNENRAAST